MRYVKFDTHPGATYVLNVDLIGGVYYYEDIYVIGIIMHDGSERIKEFNKTIYSKSDINKKFSELVEFLESDDKKSFLLK